MEISLTLMVTKRNQTVIFFAASHVRVRDRAALHMLTGESLLSFVPWPDPEEVTSRFLVKTNALEVSTRI
jgi:hypothetical protein